MVEVGETNGEATLTNPHAHLIRIPDREARKRAIMALGDSGETHCGFTDFQFLITTRQLELLKREAIPFELLS
jgi:hypothetical protein